MTCLTEKRLCPLHFYFEDSYMGENDGVFG